MSLAFRILLVVNAVATLAAGVVLLLFPAAIPATVGIVLPSEANFVAWLLGSAELGLAALCALALRLTDREALRLVAWTMLVSHLSAALADALARLAPVAIGANLAIRLLMAALFWWLGLRRA
ncbi:hypothetical protein QA641_26030 [Bradyrhizobium sp. CB1650]|uniref:hypothetical protein n=1 Tax=Bradyrhizobium sp. CB1650 TaxID=3039153 RepID=UPI002434A904|nr:hypothetical protein [Bradyrhizobium sp. CB1650]WGD49095.1 hypothetical protein QA641_26030 [Bradyrhizobium sp. CB1650]